MHSPVMRRDGFPAVLAPVIVTLFVASIVLAGPHAAAHAEQPGDANCDGVVDAADVSALIDALFDGTTCAGADANSDRSLTGADLVALASRLAQPPSSPTPSATPSPTESPSATTTDSPTATLSPTAVASPPATPTPTPSPTMSPTSLPTLPACPSAGAELEVNLDIQSGTEPISVLLSGRLAAASCRDGAGQATSYEITTTATSNRIGGLAPGAWVHTIRLVDPGTAQRQHRSGLLLANAGVNRVDFTVFASVFTVLSTADGNEGATLRQALHDAAGAAKPYLIQFDEDVFKAGEPTTILLGSALPALASDHVTLDGFDAAAAGGNRIIDAGGHSFAGLAITGSHNSVIGMRIRNAGSNNRDVVSINGDAAVGNLLEHCVVDHAASGDGIGIDAGAGTDFLDSANVVRDCEVFAASDKGIKVTTSAYARVERSWLHDNANGGLQSTLSANVTARDNLLELNTGEASAQNGLSVNGSSPDTPLIPSQLVAEGNIARFNAGSGLSLRGYSIGFISNNYLAANGRDGVRLSTEGDSPSALVEGSTAACNAVNGVVLDGAATGDFGGGALGSRGANAFTQNNLPAGAENFQNLTGLEVFASNNQWEHCGTATTCNTTAIADYDLGDHGRFTPFVPALPQRAGQAPAITAVRPSRGRAGELLRVFGSGFNAIDGHDADKCADLGIRNRCAPLRGNCVRLGDVPVALEAVTPTMLVIRLPFTCAEPVELTVTTQGGGTSTPFTVCDNAVP